MKHVALLALALACSSPAAANTVIFVNNPSTFHTAVPGAVVIEDFEDSNPALRGIALPSYTGPGNEITFVPTGGDPTPNVFLAPAGFTNFGAGNNPTTSVILTTSGNEDFTGTLSFMAFALGFDVFLNDSPLIITFYNGANIITSWAFDNPAGSDPGNNHVFIGLTSTNGITGFTLTATNGDQINTGVDNIYAQALAAPAGVPEPATWAMMLLGFGVIGMALRRRRMAAVA